MAQSLRLFIALNLADAARAELGRVIDRLRSAEPRIVKWADPAGIHFTLKFLGNVPADQVSAIESALERASQRTGPINLTLAGLGAFPAPARPRVIWAGISGDVAATASLQARLDQELQSLGFAPESRPFVPHLTLGRVRETARPEEVRRLAELLAHPPAVRPISFVVTTLDLMQSRLTPTGAVYTERAAVPLQANANLD